MVMSLREKLSYADQKMASMGLASHQRMGIMGSLMGESGRNLDTRAHNPNDPNGGSIGIGQWHSERAQGLRTYAKARGVPVDDFKTQFDYAMEETLTTHKVALDKVKAAKTSAEAAKAWTNYYERPNPKYAHHAKRAANAKYAASVLNGGTVVDDMTTESLTGAEMNKSAFSGIAGGIEGIADSLLGVSGKEGVGVNKASGGAKGGLAGMIGNYMGEANAGAKLGAIAGGIFAGPQGAIVGGLLGQGLGMMLQGIANNANAAKVNEAQHDRDYYPDAPNSPYGNSQNNGYDSLGAYGREAYDKSQQVRDVVDSRAEGLF